MRLHVNIIMYVAINASHVNIIMLYVDEVYLACRGQNFATILRRVNSIDLILLSLMRSVSPRNDSPYVTIIGIWRENVIFINFSKEL